VVETDWEAASRAACDASDGFYAALSEYVITELHALGMDR